MPAAQKTARSTIITVRAVTLKASPYILALSGALIAISSASQNALACACCSEAGQRLEKTAPMTSGQRDELTHLRFAKSTLIYADAAFPENVRGVIKPSAEDFRLRVEFLPERIIFMLTAIDHAVGKVAFTVPRQLERLEADPRVRFVKSNGGSVALYKEWRLNGDVELGGFFAGADQHARARLILHGLGNSCTSAEDFSHWTLVVTGPGTKFTLLGALDSSTTGPNDPPRP
jgi:hypothetical protein